MPAAPGKPEDEKVTISISLRIPELRRPRLPMTVRRHPRRWILAGIVVIILLAAGAKVFWQSTHKPLVARGSYIMAGEIQA
jgi:hypothetical protein